MLALVHDVPDALARCELTFLQRRPIDVARARQQHRDYCALLRRCGVEVRTVNVAMEHADAPFVEDTAIVLDELAVACLPGVASRQREVERMLPVLAEYRSVQRMRPPATLEGGDVLRLGRTLYVGISRRTNHAGAAMLAEFTAPFGYRVVPIAVHGCLHLKTACTAVSDTALLGNAAWLDRSPFAGLEWIDVPPAEPHAANALRIGDAVCLSASFPRTADLLRGRGFDVHTVAIDEFEKAEAGMTCLSLLFAR
jgi:dimethylargininase